MIFFITATAVAAPVVNRLETAASPGVALGAYDMNPAGDVMGRTVDSADTFRGVLTSATSAWTLQATMAGNLTGTLGGTISSAAIWAEDAPTTGVYTSLGTAYQTLQSGISKTTLTSGYFHIRVVIPASTVSDTYTGTLYIKATGGGSSNVVAVTLTVIVDDTYKQFEDSTNPGVALSSVTVPQGVQGSTQTTTQTFAESILESSAAWTVQATMAGNLTSGANTISSANVYAETGPSTGTYTSLGTTYKSMQTGIAAGTLTSGAFKLRIVLGATQALGTYTGTLYTRVNNGGISNVYNVTISITVIDTLKELNETGSPGVPVTAITLPEGAQGATVTSTQSFKEILNDAPAAWTATARMSADLTHSVTGTTMAATEIWVETAPLTGTFTSMGTTYRTVDTVGIGVTTTGAFRLRVVIPAAADSGTYNGTLQLQITNGGTSNVVDVALSVQVTASITFDCISLTTTCVTPVTSLNFAETAPGTSSAATSGLRANLTATNGNWAVYASVSTPFTSTTTGDSLADTAFEVQGVQQGASWAPLNGTVLVENNIANTVLNATAFTFRFSPPVDANSGTFTGAITITVSTL